MKAIRILATMMMSAGFGFFGVAKIVKSSMVTESAGWSRLTEGQWASIGVVELTAVVALLVAVHPRFRAFGNAAASGLGTLTACAVVYHLLNGDPAGDIAPAVLQGVVATAYVVSGSREFRSTSAIASPGLLAA